MAGCCRIEERKMTTAHMGLAGDISGGSGCSAPVLEGGGGADACKSADQYMKERPKKRARAKAGSGVTAAGGDDERAKKKGNMTTPKNVHSNRSPSLTLVTSIQDPSVQIASNARQQHAVAMTMATAGGGGATQSMQSSFTAHTSQAAVTTGPGSSSSSSQEGPAFGTCPSCGCDKAPTGNAPPTISPSCTLLPDPAPSLAPLTSEGAVGTSSLELDELLQSSSTEVSMETIQRIDVVTHHKRCVETYSREFSVTWGGGSTHAPVLYAVDQLSKELASKSALVKMSQYASAEITVVVAKAKENKTRRIRLPSHSNTIATVSQHTASTVAPPHMAEMTTPFNLTRATADTPSNVFFPSYVQPFPNTLNVPPSSHSSADRSGDHAYWDMSF
eukprot:Em0024g272a